MAEDKKYDSAFDEACDKDSLLSLLVGGNSEELNQVINRSKLKSLLNYSFNLGSEIAKSKTFTSSYKYNGKD
jgi:hypothetical protein